MRVKLLILLVIMGFQINPLVAEEILLLKAITEEPPNSLEGIPRPKPGMTRDNVKSVFGVPEKATEPVGNPPIYRWEYPGFIVYFEGPNVINTVIKKPNIE